MDDVLLLGGRGAGKTRAGAEWVRHVALADGRARFALIAETEHEAHEVMVEGVSGVLAVHRRGERPLWSPTRKRLAWRNGAVAQLFSAENPDALRGPQFSMAWLDELAKWRHAEATFNMLQFGLRLGERPRQVVTTTPRPMEFIKRMIADPRTALTHTASAPMRPTSHRAFWRRCSPAITAPRRAGLGAHRAELRGEAGAADQESLT